jgi:hypothetical protein
MTDTGDKPKLQFSVVILAIADSMTFSNINRQVSQAGNGLIRRFPFRRFPWPYPREA